MNCKLTVVKTGEAHKGVSPVRTETVEGYAVGEPTVGKRFELIGEAVDPIIKAKGGHRALSTSTISKIVEEGKAPLRYWLFETKSGSVYRVEETNG